MTQFTEFTQDDWMAFAGAEQASGMPPMMAASDGNTAMYDLNGCTVLIPAGDGESEQIWFRDDVDYFDWPVFWDMVELDAVTERFLSLTGFEQVN